MPEWSNGNAENEEVGGGWGVQYWKNYDRVLKNT